MITQKRIYLSPPHMGEAEQKLMTEAFTSNWIAPLGPHVDAFEKELSEYINACECNYIKSKESNSNYNTEPLCANSTYRALALSSGTAAIHLALRLLGVGTGDIVFCSTLTFVATANPVLYQGARPVFIDSDEESWNMSPQALERAFTHAEQKGQLPKAVIVVNLYGQSAQMEPILAICNRYNVPIIEDAAESLGATYQGKASGTFGRFGIFSFNGNKIITTSGGGMLVSEDREALEKARHWATQARDPALHYQHSEMGYNYRMSNILAAIGRGQLEVLNDRVQARRAIFARYVQALGDLPGVTFMPELSNGRSNRWLTALTIDENECGLKPVDVIEALAEENIESRPVWKPLHLQPLFADCLYYPHVEGESVSERLFTQGICLPSGSSLTEEEQMRVVEVIKKLFKKL
ncbi:aminotransferase class I/II-fold pyridoxal phosphate-dependent enzyme [Heliorestis acidaminivorans]|uniref:Aminotransferase class I/II-fold pyridoxal phosphate-dependent enzyme n=1 Tax=Heliorestis acidaminivorans TaxID=553427 RepID=A0A6I0F2V4_9FIRM|nr:aminotransferase class I/II-fold pyridoxal phosphate-dependent enzyme [Heliorestis acidaminivorans]KAB2953753.1 aminotransferase class I/II-fold pyridoxal phosphate-dependent enzyme [Heliorestis acidaminivorans]